MGRKPSVVVCGAGMAGLTAALCAQQAGAQVDVIEKGPDIGGSAALSGGLIWTFAALEELLEALPDGDPRLQSLVHRTLDDSVRWLREQGATVEREESIFAHGAGYRIEPVETLESLRSRIVANGGSLHFETALECLLVSEGRVRGVRARTGYGDSKCLAADATVLATGGFQGNPELLTRYVVRSATDVYLRSNPWSTGDALLAATQVGANLTGGLDAFYGHSMVAPPSRFAMSQFREASQYYGPVSIALDQYGRRFVDESAGTGEESLNAALARQEGGIGYYVLDAEIVHGDHACTRIATKTIVERAQHLGAPMVVAETLGQLCAGLGSFGVPSEAARATIQEFNRACEAGRTEFLQPRRTRNPHPVQTPPFVAIGVKAAITFTTGGLHVDDRCRVLARAASSSVLAQSITELEHHREVAIAGLYSAGSDLGGFHGRGYAGGLAAALTTGRVAGQSAAGTI